MNLRSTLLEKDTGQHTIVPNSKIDSESIEKHTIGSKTIESLSIKPESEHAAEAADVLLDMAEKHSGVLENPPPDLNYVDYDKAPVIELTFAAKDTGMSVKSDILRDFNKEVVERGLVSEEK